MKILTDEQIKELRGLMLKRKPVTEIAKQFGVSRQTIYNCCVQNNIPHGGNNFHLTVNETYKGLPYKVYCKQFHINPARVRDLMKYEEYTLGDAIEKLVKEKSKYIIDGIPAWKVAEKNGVSYRAFWNRMSAGKSLEEAIKPIEHKEGTGYRKTLPKLIEGLNKKDPSCFDTLSFILQDISKNVKIEFKTTRDVEEFLTTLNIKYDERKFNDFWNFFKRNKSFNIAQVWNDYTKEASKRKLWEIGEY